MKQITLSVLFVLLSIAGFSQPKMRLSFVLDPSVNWMKTTKSAEVQKGKSTLGYDFGLNVDYYFSGEERYALATGLQIANVGGELSYQSSTPINFSGTELSNSPKIKYKLRYLEVPFSMKLKTDERNGVYYWGLLGFSGMINIGAKGTSDDGIMKKTWIGDEVKLFNLAMNMGVGFDYDLGGSNSLTAGLIFQNGLTDVTSNKTFSDRTIINSLKLKIGLNF